MGIFSFLFGAGTNLKDVLRRGAVIIDVRTAQEFDMGKVPGSINIPVDRIASNAERIKGMNKPIIFVCQSGYRSRSAIQMMKARGLKEVYSGGNWEKLLRTMQSL